MLTWLAQTGPDLWTQLSPTLIPIISGVGLTLAGLIAVWATTAKRRMEAKAKQDEAMARIAIARAESLERSLQTAQDATESVILGVEAATSNFRCEDCEALETPCPSCMRQARRTKDIITNQARELGTDKIVQAAVERLGLSKGSSRTAIPAPQDEGPNPSALR